MKSIRLRFGMRFLLVLTSCIAGILAGYRFGVTVHAINQDWCFET